MSKAKNYLSLIKFSHTIFAMPFALIGFFLALFFRRPSSESYFEKDTNLFFDIYLRSSNPLYIKLFLIILCMIFARSAAMAFNRYLDRSFDAKNPRTAIREIPSGIISANSALLFTIVSSLLFIIMTYFINHICFLLSPVAL